MGDGGPARPVISRRPAALIGDRRGAWFGLRRRTYPGSHLGPGGWWAGTPGP